MHTNFHSPKYGEVTIYEHSNSEVPKHKKKKKGKGTKRANHKHEYENMGLVRPGQPFMDITKGEVCVHCGRINNWSFLLTEDERKQLIYDIYDNKIRFVEWNIFDKFIDLAKIKSGGQELEKMFNI